MARSANAVLCIYLMAFGLPRHRAWVVGQRLLGRSLGCSLECCGWPLGGLGGSSEASWVPLLGLLGASWGPLGASKAEGWIFQCLVSRWGPFGARLGGLLGRLGWLLGRLGALLGRLGTVLEALGPSWDGLRGSLGHRGEAARPWGLSGARLGGLLGRLGWLLGRLGALLGRLGTVLGASWAVLGRA